MENPKLDHVSALVRAHDMCVLVETRAGEKALKGFMAHLPRHTYHACFAPKPGRGGQGVAVLISERMRPFVTRWRISTADMPFQCVWVRIQGTLFGLEQDVLVGGVYVPPVTRHRKLPAVKAALDALMQDIVAAQLVTPHVMLMGDFNARVGHALEQFEDGSPGLGVECLAHPRMMEDPTSNPAGAPFMSMVASCHSFLTTGREAFGDDGRATCRDASRPDHIVLPVGLLPALPSITFPAYPHHLFDHAPIQLAFHGGAVARVTAPHQCSAACPREQVLKWEASRAEQYSQALHAQLETSSMAFQTALNAQEADVEVACTTLVDAVHSAAAVAGMVRSLPCPHRPRPPRRSAWFTADCQARKRALCRAASARSVSREAFLRVRKSYRAVLRNCKRAHERTRATNFLCALAKCKGHAVKRFMPRPARDRTQVPADSWVAHVSGHYSGGVGAEPVQPDPAAPARAADFAAPSLPDFLKRVKSALSRLDEGSSAGGDGVPAAFLKHATLTPPQGGTATTTTTTMTIHLLAPLLASLFLSVYTSGRVPRAWKEAHLTPLHKKDDPTLPANYRLLAISTVMYRLYTSCVRELLTEWCQRQEVMPDHQFGFYPGRNVQQAQFILRHLVQGRKQWGGRRAGARDVWAAFIDFQAAYDHVDRGALWGHLEHRVGVPPALLHSIRCLYEGDAYVLRDGATVTPPIHPLKGVKQGCPLSPLLFALFMSDIASSLEAGETPVGVPLGPGPHTRQEHHVSHIMFADDLTLLEVSRERLQVLVDRLALYARRKGLVVNVRKCAVMAWPRQPNAQGTQSVHYSGQALPRVKEFKFLGMWLDEKFSMGHAADRQRGPVMAAWRAVQQQALEQGLRRMPHAMLHLVQTYVLPAALFSSQVWGPDLLSMRSLYTSPLQQSLCSVYRQLLRVRSSVCAASLLDEVGAPPLQRYWLKAALVFWDHAHDADNRLLTAVLHSEWELGKLCPASWSAKLRHFLCEDIRCQALPSEGELVAPDPRPCVDAFMLHIEQQRRELTCDPRLPTTQHRARASYLYWFRMPLRDDTLTPCLHPYLCAGARLPAAWVESMARLRLSSHALRVELGRHARPPVEYQDRKCTRCTTGDAVDDEYHLLLECGATEDVRRAFADVVPTDDSPRKRMHALMHGPQPPANDTTTTTTTTTTTNHNSNSFVVVRRRAQFVHECLAVVPVTRA